MLHQAGLRNFIAVVIDMEKLTAEDRVSGHRSFSFDAHIEDMYPVLTLGGSFHIMPAEIRKNLGEIRQFLFDHKITGGGYSTAMTCLLLNTFDDLPIRFTTGGGEKMDGVYSDHIEIINVYGPTECTDDTSYYSIAPGVRAENIPIGQSVANNWNFIVDTAGNLVPQGVPGELCFAGIQVGRGYWRLPERTAQSFVPCPFVKEDRWGRPVQMYHTGDLCRWNN
jgi:non-ribosomal peptide synthetase component F